MHSSRRKTNKLETNILQQQLIEIMCEVVKHLLEFRSQFRRLVFFFASLLKTLILVMQMLLSLNLAVLILIIFFANKKIIIPTYRPCQTKRSKFSVCFINTIVTLWPAIFLCFSALYVPFLSLSFNFSEF